MCSVNPGEPRQQAWLEELQRMREMQYAYHAKFFQGIYFFLVLVIACLALDRIWSVAFVPFLIITAGTQSCFYLHFVDFARLSARHLEKRLNQELGKDSLIGSKVEDLYFYPVDAPKVGGFVFSRPLRFFSVFTLHWVLLWVGFASFALWKSLSLTNPAAREYLIILGIWGGLNFGYLTWFFIARRDFQRTRRALEKS